ncbi:DEAD/DEAH box helicase [Pseudonocardia nigra]|uniref:DEAD/DEAH box helicase n=1 Tax=Pseudonocardia nigra TaxID=1921578 RepID=UPI001C5D41F3|nr:DEAD/DEAH box helicase [Pseudonocardia nigra]
MSAFARLHPVIQHHVVNTLQWPGLRPLQEAAVAPVLDGVDCLLLAPTAGGKTEAAVFPLLSHMAGDGWTGTSVLYVCPLRALLNNLQPRLHDYAAWVGRSAALWHGDTGQGVRRRILRERPDILLTTPESLESMLVSASIDSRLAFADVRAVVVDEVHAFAGDDRGWHLLHVLERLAELAGRPLQRVGLSATVGNPEELLGWLQGAAPDRRRAVVAPPAAAPAGDVQLDHVGSVDGAATVISRLHRGEKRLVFVDSRRRAEELGTALRLRDVDTYLSHSSLSPAERRRSEEAFAEARDCVIVATSTLELGIDVGDLDRVIQIGAPRTVASFLQRIGRTGRRPGSSRNCLFLALDHDQLLHAAGLLVRWSEGWVEPVVPPPSPRHIVAQQLLALALQEHTLGRRTWPEWWHELAPMTTAGAEILEHLVAEGFLETDGDLAFIGPEAERRFGRRHFSDLMAVFTAAPEFVVLAGRDEIGSVGDDVLLADTGGAPRVLLLAGRAWLVTYVDWKRRRCFVEATDLPGRAKWSGDGGGLSFAVTRGMRDVLLGAGLPDVRLSRRAAEGLADLRQHHSGDVVEAATVVRRSPEGDVHWWTWAGVAANRSLQATLGDLVDPRQRLGDQVVRLRRGADLQYVRAALAGVETIAQPAVDARAVAGLKFSAALPDQLARATVGQRLGDSDGARTVLGEPRRLAVDAS